MSHPGPNVGNEQSRLTASDVDAGPRKRQMDDTTLGHPPTSSQQGSSHTSLSKPRPPTKRRTDDVNHSQGPSRKVSTGITGSHSKPAFRPTKSDIKQPAPVPSSYLDSADLSDEIICASPPPKAAKTQTTKLSHAGGTPSGKSPTTQTKSTSAATSKGEKFYRGDAIVAKGRPHAFVPSSRLQPDQKTKKHLQRWAAEFQPKLILADSKGYYIYFENDPTGHRDLDRCCEKDDLLLGKYHLRPEPRHGCDIQEKPVGQRAERKAKDAGISRPPSSSGLTSASDVSSSVKRPCWVCRTARETEPAFKCTTCDRRWHRSCHPKPSMPSHREVLNGWQCKSCIKRGVPPLNLGQYRPAGAETVKPHSLKLKRAEKQDHVNGMSKASRSIGPKSVDEAAKPMSQTATTTPSTGTKSAEGNESSKVQPPLEESMPKTKALDAIHRKLDRAISAEPPKQESPRAAVNDLLRKGTPPSKPENMQLATSKTFSGSSRSSAGPTAMNEIVRPQYAAENGEKSKIQQTPAEIALPALEPVGQSSTATSLLADPVSTAIHEESPRISEALASLDPAKEPNDPSTQASRDAEQKRANSASLAFPSKPGISERSSPPTQSAFDSATPFSQQHRIPESADIMHTSLPAATDFAMTVASLSKHVKVLVEHALDTQEQEAFTFERLTKILTQIKSICGKDSDSHALYLTTLKDNLKDKLGDLQFLERAVRRYFSEPELMSSLMALVSGDYCLERCIEDGQPAVRIVRRNGDIAKVIRARANAALDLSQTAATTDSIPGDPVDVDTANTDSFLASEEAQPEASGNENIPMAIAAPNTVSTVSLPQKESVAPAAHNFERTKAQASTPHPVEVTLIMGNDGNTTDQVTAPATYGAMENTTQSLKKPGPILTDVAIGHSIDDSAGTTARTPAHEARDAPDVEPKLGVVQRVLLDEQSDSSPAPPSSRGSPPVESSEHSARPPRLTAKRTKSKPKILGCRDCGKKIVQHTDRTTLVCPSCKAKRQSSQNGEIDVGLKADSVESSKPLDPVQSKVSGVQFVDTNLQDNGQAQEDVQMTGTEADAELIKSDNATVDEMGNPAKSPAENGSTNVQTPSLTPSKPRKGSKSKGHAGDGLARDGIKKTRIMKIGGTFLGDSYQRPKGTYEVLIGLAMSTTPDLRMQCRGVCCWIAKNIESYDLGVDQWESGIGATLSIHEGIKSKQLWEKVDWVEGESEEFGKGCWYAIKPGKAETLARWDAVTKAVIWPPGKEPKEAPAEEASPSNTPKQPKQRKPEPEQSAPETSAEQAGTQRKAPLEDTPSKVSKKRTAKGGSREKGVSALPPKDNGTTRNARIPTIVDMASPAQPKTGRPTNIVLSASVPLPPVKQLMSETSLLESVRRSANDIPYTAKSLWDEWPQFDPDKQVNTESKIAEIKERPTRKQMFKSNSLNSRLVQRGGPEDWGNTSGSEQAALKDGEKPSSRRGAQLFPAEDHIKDFTTVREFLGIPNNPVPTLRNGTLGYRDGTRDEWGNLPRARNIYSTGL